MVRLALYLTAVNQAPHFLSFFAVFFAHDGGEYLAFAEILQGRVSGPLPAEVVRHDPGLAFLTVIPSILTGKFLSLPIAAVLVQLICLATGLWATLRLTHYLDHSPAQRLKFGLLVALGYPATVYYGLFHLTELPFMAFIMSSLLCFAGSRFWLAFLLAGLAAVVRSTGLILVASLALAHPAVLAAIRIRNPFQMETLKSLWPVAAGFLIGVLPWLLGQAGIHHFYQSTVASHKPAFGLPFSGFAEMTSAGTIRMIYILLCVGFFLTSAALWTRRASSAGWSHPLSNLLATFLVLFVAFHLCLKSLYYIDRTVLTFDYQDRYLAPLWPVALLAWRRPIPWAVVRLAIGIAIVFSAMWLRNYLHAAFAG